MNKQKRAWKRTINRRTMKQAAIILIALGTFITGSPIAQADSGNPFGFETNKHPLEYEYCKKEPGLFRGHGYTCSSAPRPHPDILGYKLQFVEDIGLCRISAYVDKVLLRDIKNTIAMFKGQIVKKYGPATIPTEEEARASSVLLYYWAPKAGFNGLGEVKQIDIRAYDANEDPLIDILADDLNRNWVNVSFWLVTSDACLKKIDEKAGHAF